MRNSLPPSPTCRAVLGFCVGSSLSPCARAIFNNLNFALSSSSLLLSPCLPFLPSFPFGRKKKKSVQRRYRHSASQLFVTLTGRAPLDHLSLAVVQSFSDQLDGDDDGLTNLVDWVPKLRLLLSFYSSKRRRYRTARNGPHLSSRLFI